jgi:hypothetical protein
VQHERARAFPLLTLVRPIRRSTKQLAFKTSAKGQLSRFGL